MMGHKVIMWIILSLKSYFYSTNWLEIDAIDEIYEIYEIYEIDKIE